MYYTTIPLVSERAGNRRWDAAKLRELRKRLDSGSMSMEEIDQVTADFMDSEIVDLASDWLGNTVSFILPSPWRMFQLFCRSSKNYLKGARQFLALRCWNALPLISP
jgi:hypothetical protein